MLRIEVLVCLVPDCFLLYFLINFPCLWCVGVSLQLHYGEPVIRRAVPLGLALLSVSDPKLKVLDTLSKLSHDADQEVALNAILALGIVGAGKKLVVSNLDCTGDLSLLNLYQPCV